MSDKYLTLIWPANIHETDLDIIEASCNDKPGLIQLNQAKIEPTDNPELDHLVSWTLVKIGVVTDQIKLVPPFDDAYRIELPTPLTNGVTNGSQKQS